MLKSEDGLLTQTERDKNYLQASMVRDDPVKLAAYIGTLRRIANRKPVVVVESVNDNPILQDFLTTFEFEITCLIMNGKDKSIDTVSNCYSEGISGVAALVDADFDRSEWGKSYDCQVITTDLYDLEAFAIHSDKWRNVLREFLDEGKLSNHGISSFEELRTICVELCLPVVAVMAINYSEESGIKFSSYDFDNNSGINFDERSNTLDLVINRLQQLNQSRSENKFDWSKKDDLKLSSDGAFEAFNSSGSSQYTSSTILCKCLISICNRLNIFKRDIKGQQKDADHIKNWFRSHVTNEILYESRMRHDLENWFISEGFS